MTISDAMWHHAQDLISADCQAAWEKANPKKTRPSGHGRAKFKPYVIPQRCQDLVKALGTGDPEQVSAVILYQFQHKLSEAEL